MVTQDDEFLWRFLEIIYIYMVSAYDVRIPHSERYYGNIMISDILGACRGHIMLYPDSISGTSQLSQLRCNIRIVTMIWLLHCNSVHKS